MISLTAEYALRAVVCIGSGAGRPVTTGSMAKQAQIPRAYLCKVLRALSRAGLVCATRGLHGGYRLEADPRRLTVLDVINCVDPIRRIEHCPLALEHHRARLCPMHRRMDSAIAAAQRALAGATIAHIVAQSIQESPLCEDESTATNTRRRKA